MCRVLSYGYSSNIDETNFSYLASAWVSHATCTLVVFTLNFTIGSVCIWFLERRH